MTAASIEQRLVRLERQNRRLRAATAATAALVAAVLAMGAAQTQPAQSQPHVLRADAVVAQEFRLVDESGQVRALLQMSRGEQGVGPGLVLLDERMQARASLFTSKEGTALVLAGEDGRERFSLAETPRGAYLLFADDDGDVRARLGVREGNPWLVFLDKDGAAVWGAPR